MTADAEGHDGAVASPQILGIHNNDLYRLSSALSHRSAHNRNRAENGERAMFYAVG